MLRTIDLLLRTQKNSNPKNLFSFLSVNLFYIVSLNFITFADTKKLDFLLRTAWLCGESSPMNNFAVVYFPYSWKFHFVWEAFLNFLQLGSFFLNRDRGENNVITSWWGNFNFPVEFREARWKKGLGKWAGKWLESIRDFLSPFIVNLSMDGGIFDAIKHKLQSKGGEMSGKLIHCPSQLCSVIFSIFFKYLRFSGTGNLESI